MTVLRKYNAGTSQWDIIFTGSDGPTGPTGPTGATGPTATTSGNLDGGVANSSYGGISTIDGGSA